MQEEHQDMDVSYQTTPNRSDLCKVRRKTFDRSSLSHPYKCNVELNSTALKPGNIIETMPLYTPPKPTQHIKNPFEHAWLLKEKLSRPTCSPSLFQKVISPIHKSMTFSWNIEEIADLHPAPIDETQSQDFASWYSPDTETQAQAAIDRFFSSMSHGTLESPAAATREAPSKKSVACQTEFTCPAVLPPQLQKELAILQAKIGAWIEDPSLLNLSSCSARRKLLSAGDHDDLDSNDSVTDQENSFEPVFAATPVKGLSSPECSPIRPDNQSLMDISNICRTPSGEESGFHSQNSLR